MARFNFRTCIQEKVGGEVKAVRNLISCHIEIPISSVDTDMPFVAYRSSMNSSTWFIQ